MGVGIYGVGVTPKVGYLKGSDGAAPLYHASTFSEACFDCRLSLLNSLGNSTRHAADGSTGTTWGPLP